MFEPTSELSRCGCGGFAPLRASACPHCDAAMPSRASRVARALATIAGGGAFMVTLMACYGRPHQNKACTGENSDGDQSCLPEDCNDKNAAVYPGAHDPESDGTDQNCDGVDGYKPAP